MPSSLTHYRHQLVSSLMGVPPAYDFYVSRVKRGLGKVRSAEYDLLRQVEAKLPRPLQFMQIGANDGMRNDPAREFIVEGNWHGVLVEPNPFAFEQLKQNYAYCNRGHLHFREAAISNQGGTLPIFTHRLEYLRTLPREVALNMTRKTSANRQHLEMNGCHDSQGATIPGAIENIVRVEVPCMTVAQAIEGVFPQPRLDLLVMDVEGHERAVLEAIDFQAVPVKAIFFEYEHLAGSEGDVRQLLEGNGFTLIQSGRDALAVHHSVGWQGG